MQHVHHLSAADNLRLLHAFADAGDCGFGFCANSLVLGCDCVGHIAYLDGVVNDADGALTRILRAYFSQNHTVL